MESQENTSQEERQVDSQSSKEEKLGALRRLWEWCTTHKKASIPLAILLVVGVLAAIPVTRYALAGTVVKRTLVVTVKDEETLAPVSSVAVTVDGISVQTNSKGQANLRLPVGPTSVSAAKKYYTSNNAKVFVPLFKNGAHTVHIKATGRQVPVKAVHKLTGKPLADVTIKASGTQTKTDKNGKAVIVLPAGQKTVVASVRAGGYNSVDSKVEVTTAEVDANSFALTPTGKIYFLSNARGTIDVVKTNLDGSDRQTVLAGTGKEEQANTTLLASRDWKYLALLSKRDGGEKLKLFLIDTSTDELTTMDEGKADFTLSGWSDTHFVYTVTRAKYQDSQAKKVAVKSFDATTRKIAILAESEVDGGPDGYAYQIIVNPLLVGEGNKVVYHTQWYNGGPDHSLSSSLSRKKSMEIISVDVDGTSKKTLRTIPALNSEGYYTQLESYPYAPGEIYYRAGPNFYEYEDGQVKEASDMNNDKFYSAYSTYLESPSGNKTFWSEPRDGKNTLFIGDAKGENGKLFASLSEYQTYGWYTEEYVLISKSGSELYVMSSKGAVDTKPFKISDYYKPSNTYRGYGGGYGGI